MNILTVSVLIKLSINGFSNILIFYELLWNKTAPTAEHNKQVVQTNYHETIRVSAHTMMGAKILLIYYTRGYFPKD